MATQARARCPTVTLFELEMSLTEDGAAKRLKIRRETRYARQRQLSAGVNDIVQTSPLGKRKAPRAVTLFELVSDFGRPWERA